MKSPEQLKGSIRNIAKKNDVQAQRILQLFLYERLLDRLSHSVYKHNFVLKGGLLISSMIGVASRTTMDMDATVKGIPMTIEDIEKIIREIIQIDVGDGIQFQFIRSEPIRKQDEYSNFRIHLVAMYGKIHNEMTIDITTGDEIYPAPVTYGYPLMFSADTVNIKAYPIETILAEKFETVIHRGIANTRSRDFYDLYVLFHQYFWKIDRAKLKESVIRTAQKRGSLSDIRNYQAICAAMKNDTYLRDLWSRYVQDEKHAGAISFEEAVQNVIDLGDYLFRNDGQ